MTCLIVSADDKTKITPTVVKYWVTSVIHVHLLAGKTGNKKKKKKKNKMNENEEDETTTQNRKKEY